MSLSDANENQKLLCTDTNDWHGLQAGQIQATSNIV